MPETLNDLLLSLGKTFEMTGKTPFFLDGAENLWCVLEGQLDVFFTPRRGPVQTGTRDYLFTAGKGDFLFGVASGEDAEEGFIVSGIPGTKVLACSRSVLFGDAAERFSGAVVAGTDRFLECLGRGMVKDVLPLPRIQQRFGEGPGKLAPHLPAGPEKRLLWARFEAGGGLFIGTEDLSPRSGFFAVPPECWIVPQEGTRLRGATTEAMLAAGELEEAFDSWYSLVFSVLSLNTMLRAADDLGTLRSAQKGDRNSLARAAMDLSSALEHTPSSRTLPEEEKSAEGAVPLRRIFARVASELGLAGDLPGSDALRDLEELAAAADIRLREVRFEGAWWRHDGPPLVAFLDEGKTRKTPVALLPGGEYRVWDGTREYPLDETTASRLGDSAWQLYPSLPQRPLTLRNLLGFGLKRGRSAGSALAGRLSLLPEMLMALLSLVPPAMNRLLYGEVIPNAEKTSLFGIFLVLVAVGVSSGLLRFAQEIALSRSEASLSHRIALGFWDRFLRLPVRFFARHRAGDLVNRGMGLFILRRNVSPALRSLRIQGIFVVFHLAQCFWYDRRATLAGGACLLALGLLAAAGNALLLRATRKMVTVQNSLSALTFQILSGISRIRATRSEHRAFERWVRLFRDQRRLATSGRKAQDMLARGMAVFPLAGTLAILLALASRLGGDGTPATGRIMAFLSSWGALQIAFLGGLASLTTLTATLPLAENLRPVLEIPPESGTFRSDPGKITGRIHADNITFRYTPEGRPVLSDLTLHVEAGEFLALVGPSGCGKSTLIRLLLGFDLPERGGIFYDSRDLNDLDLKKLRSQIGVVLQGGGLLSGDIAANVRAGRPLSMDQVEEALELAGLSEELAAMPMGVHTVISEGAGTFSGGQKQRLLIARAVAGKPRVLIFDEATSALDNRTQALITRSLEKMDATRIVVAHRLSTVVRADRIVVLDQGGHLAQEGTYEELLAREGLFRELARRQLVSAS